MNWGRQGLAVFVGLGCWLWLWLGMPETAIASVHHYPEGAERVMVRSLQTLHDRRDRSWQVVMFKRVNAGQMESVHLRVVGFPGEIEFKHPAPLAISGSTQGWLAADSLADHSDFPANVGEYDVLEPMTHLASNHAVRLFLPTTTGTIELTVPAIVVQEWRQVIRDR